MNRSQPLSMLIRIVSVGSLVMLCACAEVPVAQLSDGSSVRQLILQQTSDPQASARNGTAIPVGTDPDMALGAVQRVRTGASRDATTTPRTSATELVSGVR